MANPSYTGTDTHLKELARLIEANSYRHRRHEVFRDFCEIAALSISNAVDRSQFDAREARYLEVVGRYERQEVARFPQMLGCLVESLQAGLHDALGSLFMAMSLGDHWRGQFFTPYEVALMMAKMTMHDAGRVIEQQGFITLCEPAAGAGGMVLACANSLHDDKINYQRTMHATLVDVCPTAVHMAYVQLSLCHVPAIVLHGNALTLEEWGHWVTPAHVLGGWDYKLARRGFADAATTAPTPDPVPEVIAVPACLAPESLQPISVPSIERQRATVLASRISTGNQLGLFD